VDERIARLECAVHLPLIDFGEEGPTLARLTRVAGTALDCGLAAVAANDHFLFASPWLDGPTALAAVLAHCGGMDLATTVSLVALRGPVPVAKTLTALALLADGRVIAGVGPGSSQADWDAIGVPFEERWPRFDEATSILRALLRGEPPPEPRRFYSGPDAPLLPAGRPGTSVPVWIGSWGSEAGLRRVARLGDGWLASAYNTTPEGFAAARETLSRELRSRDRDPGSFPNALATMWTWITPDDSEADRVVREVLGPLLKRDPDMLRERLCIGSPQRCAELLSRYAEAGCERVYLWPVGDEARQIELAASAVMPHVSG
jgi:alkanesulfonate monooxygenase SsuD/methylene tetrahydromethanopterin reductase-like flavin-dependent oxidoreductase (luciferase family)